MDNDHYEWLCGGSFAARALMVLMVFGGLAAPAQGQATFRGIGDLPGGLVISRVSAVSADGLTVVGSSWSDSGEEAFRWRLLYGIEGCGDLPGGIFESRALEVSADGSVVVGSSQSESGMEAFVWTGGREPLMLGLGDLPGGMFFSFATAVTADGLIVFGTGLVGGGVRWPFRWTQAEGLIAFETPLIGQVSWYLRAATPDGMITGGHFSNANGQGEGYSWTQITSLIPFGIPNTAFTSRILDISADGVTFVGEICPFDIYLDAVKWTAEEGWVSLGDLPGLTTWYSKAHAVSGDGSIIVGYSRPDGVVGYQNGHAFVWNAKCGMRKLSDILRTYYSMDLGGWHLFEATGISDDGLTIVGTGINPEGNEEGWIVTLVAGQTIPADTDKSGDVNVTDLLCVLGAWGPNPGHIADLNSDGMVNVSDLLKILAAWGPCP